MEKRQQGRKEGRRNEREQTSIRITDRKKKKNREM
jgi:hypothetical protein